MRQSFDHNKKSPQVVKSHTDVSFMKKRSTLVINNISLITFFSLKYAFITENMNWGELAGGQ
jgi:hypothetical protein